MEQHHDVKELSRLSRGAVRFEKILMRTKDALKKKALASDKKDSSMRKAMKAIETQIAANEETQVERLDQIKAGKIAFGKALALIEAKAKLKGQLSKAKNAKTKALLAKSMAKTSYALVRAKNEEVVKLEEAAVAHTPTGAGEALALGAG